MASAPDPQLRDVYHKLQELKLYYLANPNKKRLLIDRSPFYDEGPQRTEIETNAKGKFVIVIGRILPTSKIYGQSAFVIELKLPIEFPFKAPHVKLLTQIHHPNIGRDGLVCLPMLRSNDKWENTYTLLDVINATVDLIDNPRPAEAFDKEIRDEYNERRAEFEQKALRMIQANPVSRDP